MAKGLEHALQVRGYANRMRQNCTPSERALWGRLRAKQLGVHFRRQVPLLERYIVDFWSPRARLAVEIDGGYHEQARHQRADARRDQRLEDAGYRVLRISATLVTHDLDAAVTLVKAALRLQLSSRTPQVP
jgi:very-short-patch-repair endonuclease